MKWLYIGIWKLLQKVESWIYWNYSNTIHINLLKRLNIKHEECKFLGKTHFRVAKGGYMELGNNFFSQSGDKASIDTSIECKLQVEQNGKLIIGVNVGISSTIIHAWESIEIQDDVKIGAGCFIFDTNFHSVDPEIRKTENDQKNAKTAPVIIKQNAFIGARSIITKGVSVGKNSIVAAGSVVVRSVPDNEIWGGNPAMFIRKI